MIKEWIVINLDTSKLIGSFDTQKDAEEYVNRFCKTVIVQINRIIENGKDTYFSNVR